MFAHGATVLTVAYGVNDIGWGLKADAEHKRASYLLEPDSEGVFGTDQKTVRITLCDEAPSPSSIW